MRNRRYSWAAAIAVCGLVVAAVTMLRPQGAQAQPQYPIMDSIANKIITKYQTSTCEQLWKGRINTHPRAPRSSGPSEFYVAIRKCVRPSSTRLPHRSPTKCSTAE